MIATHTYKNQPAKLIKITFVITEIHLETAVVALFAKGIGPTKKKVKDELMHMLTSGGGDGSTDWVHETDWEEYREKAHFVSKKMFPTFYQ